VIATQELPIVDASAYFFARLEGRDAGAEAAQLGIDIKNACHAVGMFYLVGYDIDQALIDKVMQKTAWFFASDQGDKDAISIKKSPQFRGYGLLKNYRDWREQIHIGVESSLLEIAASDSGLAKTDHYWQLWGKNQWPSTTGSDEFKNCVLDYFAAVEALARDILTLLAQALDKPSNFFTERMKNRPYLLMKAMSYLPQEKRGEDSAQMGVTAHCDWSWLTFLVQDQVGGLEAQDIEGNWRKVTPLPNSIVVNTGELLEIETGGYLRASPHRVINERIDRQRFSVPVFINPALDARILPGSADGASVCSSTSDDEAHVHKVIKPGTSLDSFVFGESEYERKAKGVWCYSQQCVTAL
jgi:isopenicillin N synthase-like dioxygenase